MQKLKRIASLFISGLNATIASSNDLGLWFKENVSTLARICFVAMAFSASLLLVNSTHEFIYQLGCVFLVIIYGCLMALMMSLIYSFCHFLHND
jgi:hypothetical protein